MNFTFYEQVGILIPGAVLLASIATLLPDLNSALTGGGVTIGDLGLFLILAYAAGHAVAAIGNVMEKMFWGLFGGMPTDWVTKNPPKLLNPEQVSNLATRVKERCGLSVPVIPGLSRKQWAPIYGQIYRDVLASNAGRVDTFNGNYGLNRGLAAALVCVTIALGVICPPHVGILMASAVALALVYLYRMYRFGVHFAREVFFCFLNPRPEKGSSTGALQKATME